MKNVFKPGDYKTYSHTVTEKDIAAFETGMVHELYSTFALARDAEWSSRLFVLEMKEEHEEGIGTFVNVQHKAAAKMGDVVLFTAVIKSIERNEIICSIIASVNDKTIAEIETGQKILSKEKLKNLLG